MSNTINPESTIDLKQLSLHILRQLDKHSDNKKVFFGVFGRKRCSELNIKPETLDRWGEWEWDVHNVLKGAGLIQPSVLPDKTYTYELVITDKGKDFIKELEAEGLKNEKEAEWDKMWAQYTLAQNQWSEFISDQNQSLPETIKRYINVVQHWKKRGLNFDAVKDNNTKNDTWVDNKRKHRNSRRILAEYYASPEPLSEEDLAKRIESNHTVNPRSNIESFLAKNFDFPEGCPRRGEFLKDERLLPALRNALKEVIGEEELKEWQKIRFIPGKETKKSNTKGQEKKSEKLSGDMPQDESLRILKDIDEILAYKKQIILYGAPGTGKTFNANRYVEREYRDEAERKKYVYRCTFHPEYGYEHFIEGLRPSINENKQVVFKLKDGIFKELCKKAENDWEQVEDKKDVPKYYIIIDEINRGDIPRIFGELITLIEADKRNPKYGVALPLSGDKEDKFFVPPNVYIIATMNTADRSIALLDTALRRRFGFLPIPPDSSLFEGITVGVPKGGTIPLRTWFAELNRKLENALKESRHDVEHILIGHSFFLPLASLDSDRFKQIIQNEILPLIQEYCYEDKTARETLEKHIKDTTGISPIGQSTQDRSESAEAQRRNRNE